MFEERSSFNCFPQIIIANEENMESITKLTNSKMSSRGGEASGAAASGRARVSGRQPAAGGGSWGRLRFGLLHVTLALLKDESKER